MQENREKNKKVFDNKYAQYINNYQDFANLEIASEVINQNKKEIEIFNQKLQKFNEIQSLEEAKKMAKELFFIQNEINYIHAGDIYCTIINRNNLLRIVIKSENKITCYNFIAKEN